MSDDNKLITERKKKLEELSSVAKLYPNTFRRNTNANELRQKYDGKSKEELESEDNIFSVSGRLLTVRKMGNSTFANLHDDSGKIQLFLSKNGTGKDMYSLLNQTDLGDIVGAKGKIFKTKTGELSINVSEYIILSKSLRPLPEKYHGLSDVEIKYRQRYVDLMISENSRKVFKDRINIVSHTRKFFEQEAYLEVETPMMHPIAGGAAAKPFITHHNSLDMNLYLRIAPELYLKRLIIGGFEKVFEINRSFRNEGLSTRHNPEFTMLEYYEAFTSLDRTIELTQNMIQKSSEEVNGTLELEWGEDKINLSSFRKANLADLVLEENKKLTKNDIEKMSGKDLLELFENTVEENLIQPTFVIGYPIEVSPLSRRNNENPNIADRFELFIGGKEFANGFCELNDPDDQAERFKEQAKAKDTGDKEAMSFDEDYVIALEHGMPPAVGVGIGVDRLVMLLTNQTSIRDVLLFPQLKS